MNVVGELFELADQISSDRAMLDQESERFERLRRAAESVGRSWSGSNLGYQARVYYLDFQPVPPGVVFSVEWGLEERWPVHDPDQGWTIADDEAPRREVVARAGGGDPDELEARLGPIRKKLRAHMNDLASILSAAVKANGDAFLEKRLKELEALESPPDSRGVAAQLLPRGQIMSRDSQAFGGGLQVAPHQWLLALAYSYDLTRDFLAELEQMARVATAHLARLNQEGRAGVQTGGMVTFIGHGRSLVWHELKDFLKERLGLAVSEFNTVSAAGIPTVNRLQEMLDSAAFAFIIMTGEDEQADGEVHARQNVIHEAGLFQGRLGFGKAIILLEDGCADFSNIHGLGVLPFAKGKISSCFEEVRRVLERERIVAA